MKLYKWIQYQKLESLKEATGKILTYKSECVSQIF
jgi:hypothetical protein